MASKEEAQWRHIGQRLPQSLRCARGVQRAIAVSHQFFGLDSHIGERTKDRRAANGVGKVECTGRGGDQNSRRCGCEDALYPWVRGRAGTYLVQISRVDPGCFWVRFTLSTSCTFFCRSWRAAWI